MMASIIRIQPINGNLNNIFVAALDFIDKTDWVIGYLEKIFNQRIAATENDKKRE